MNKKQLLERQITKEFLNESLDLNENNQDGVYTTQLKRTGKGVAGSIASALIPGSDTVVSITNFFKNLFSSGGYKGIRDNMSPTHYNDLKHVSNLISKLQQGIEPNNLEILYKEDKENFAFNLVNQALKGVLISGSEYQLQNGVAGGEAGKAGELPLPNRRMEKNNEK